MTITKKTSSPWRTEKKSGKSCYKCGRDRGANRMFCHKCHARLVETYNCETAEDWRW